jgi:hypothetical protein
MEKLIKSLGEPVEGNEYIIKHINGEWWIEHKEVGSGEPLKQWLETNLTPVERTPIEMSDIKQMMGAMDDAHNEIKVGDKCRVVDSWYGHIFDIGEEIIVERVDEEDPVLPYYCSNGIAEKWVSSKEIEKL